MNEKQKRGHLSPQQRAWKKQREADLAAARFAVLQDWLAWAIKLTGLAEHGSIGRAIEQGSERAFSRLEVQGGVPWSDKGKRFFTRLARFDQTPSQSLATELAIVALDKAEPNYARNAAAVTLGGLRVLGTGSGLRPYLREAHGAAIEIVYGEQVLFSCSSVATFEGLKTVTDRTIHEVCADMDLGAPARRLLKGIREKASVQSQLEALATDIRKVLDALGGPPSLSAGEERVVKLLQERDQEFATDDEIQRAYAPTSASPRTRASAIVARLRKKGLNIESSKRFAWTDDDRHEGVSPPEGVRTRAPRSRLARRRRAVAARRPRDRATLHAPLQPRAVRCSVESPATSCHSSPEECALVRRASKEGKNEHVGLVGHNVTGHQGNRAKARPIRAHGLEPRRQRLPCDRAGGQTSEASSPRRPRALH